MGRSLVIIGLLAVAAGLLVMLAERFSLWPGRLPGDIVWRGKNTTIYLPLGTSLLISLLLTLGLWLLRRR